MASVVESLVITMGIDPKGYMEGARKIRDDLKKTSGAATTAANDMESVGKRAANYFASLKNEVVGLMLAFAGANSLKGFVGDMLDGAASAGRLSANIEESTSKIGAWRAAVKEAGGTAQDADNALSSMSNAISNWNLMRDTGNDAVFRQLGVTPDTLAHGPAAMLMQINDAVNRMTATGHRREAVNLLQRLGFSPAMISVLERSRKELEAQLPVLERQAALTQGDADAAQKLQAKLSDLSSLIQGKARPYISDLADAIGSLLTNTDAMNLAGPVFVGVLGSMGTAALIAYGSFALLASVIAGLVIAYKDLKHLMNMTPEERKRFDNQGAQLRSKAWAQLKSGDIGGFFSTWWQGFSDRVAGDTAAPTGNVPNHVAGAIAAAGRSGRHVALDGNNPGGIEDGPFARRQPGYVGANGRYAAFDTLAHGEQAQEALLGVYIRRGQDTPWKIASAWAPSSENDTAAYAAQIAKRLGIGINSHLTMDDAKRFARAQGLAENGAYRPSSSNSQTFNITINTDGKNAGQIAREIEGAVRKRMSAMPANSGLSG